MIIVRRSHPDSQKDNIQGHTIPQQYNARLRYAYGDNHLFWRLASRREEKGDQKR